MTHIGDGVQVGRKSVLASRPLPVTVDISKVSVYDITPLTLQAANIVASVTASGATSLTLAAGTGVTSVTFGGKTCIKMDVPRNIRIVSAADDSAVTFTVSGFDVYGMAMTETITGANTSTAQGSKAFMYVWKILTSGSTTGAITVGTGDKFGLPYRVLNASQVAFVKWASTLAQDAGTLTGADTTSPATATTTDVRGLYAPSSASNGSRRLVMGIYLPDTNGSISTLLGVDQV